MIDDFIEVKDALKKFRFYRSRESYYTIICEGKGNKSRGGFILQFREDEKKEINYIYPVDINEQFSFTTYIKNRDSDLNKISYQEVGLDEIPQNILLEICNILKINNINLNEE